MKSRLFRAGIGALLIAAASLCAAQDEIGFGFEEPADAAAPAIAMGGEVLYTLRAFPGESWEMESEARAVFGLELSSGAISAAFRALLDPGILKENPERVLDEAWAAVDAGAFELKAGLIKLPWGRADSLRVLDILNPQDYGAPPTGESNERSIAQPMLRFDFELGSFARIQAVWEPCWEGNRIPFGGKWEPAFSRDLRERLASMAYHGTNPAANGGRGDGLYYLAWAQAYAVAYAATGGNSAAATIAADSQAAALSAAAQEESEARVFSAIGAVEASDLSRSQAGARLEASLSGLDFGLQYWYGFNRLPTLDQSALAAALAGGSGSILAYDRLHHCGLDFACVLWDINLRAEAAANITEDLDGDDPSVRNGTFEWAAGADRDVAGIAVNVQAKQARLLGADKRAPMADADDALSPVATTLALSLKESLARDKLELSIAGLWVVEESEGLVLPSVSLFVKDDLRIRLLGRYFFGPEDGSFGGYADMNGAELSLRYQY